MHCSVIYVYIFDALLFFNICNLFYYLLNQYFPICETQTFEDTEVILDPEIKDVESSSVNVFPFQFSLNPSNYVGRKSVLYLHVYHILLNKESYW